MCEDEGVEHRLALIPDTGKPMLMAGLLSSFFCSLSEKLALLREALSACP